MSEIDAINAASMQKRDLDNLRKELQAQVKVGEKAAAMIRDLNEERHALTEEKERLQSRIAEFQKEVCALGVQRDEAEGEAKALERECWETTATNAKLRMALAGLVRAINKGVSSSTLRANADGKDSLMYAANAALSPQPEGQDND